MNVDRLGSAFDYGIECLLGTWTALQLAIQHRQQQHQPSAHFIASLQSEILDYFTEYGNRVDEESMQLFYDAYFQDVFDTVVEDDSLAKETCRLHALCERHLAGDLIRQWEEALARMPLQPPAQLCLTAHGSEQQQSDAAHLDHGTEDSANDDASAALEADGIDMNMEVDRADAVPSESDEGWTMVKTNRRPRSRPSATGSTIPKPTPYYQ